MCPGGSDQPALYVTLIYGEKTCKNERFNSFIYLYYDQLYFNLINPNLP